MPKKSVTISWACDICGESHTTLTKAERCERKGIVRPRYRMGQRVSVKRPKERMQGIVCQVLTMFMHPFEHDAPIRYIICPDTATGEQTVIQIIGEEKDMRPLGGSKRSKAKKNVPNWPAFWKAFGADDMRARRNILLHLRERGIKVRRLTGEPKLAPKLA